MKVVFLVHAMKVYGGERKSVSPHSLITVLDGGEWSNLGLESFIHAKKNPWFSSNRKLSGPRNRFGQFLEKITFPAPARIRNLDSPARTLVIIPTTLHRPRIVCYL